MIENNVKGFWKLDSAPPPNSYSEVLSPGVTLFGVRTLKEVKLNEVIRVALIQ